jgi:thymidylate kinase
MSEDLVFTVALVGGDGAGKTTIAKRLERSSPFPVKYLYMGLAMQSSNRALLTSRLVLFLKLCAYRKKMRKAGKVPPDFISDRELDSSGKKRGAMWRSMRFLNRLAEAWYRQLVSVGYQMRGYVVVYDRHFLFETAPPADGCGRSTQPRLDELYYWIMSHLYPQPALTIMLDAPPEVLYERKGEATPEYLSEQRQAFLEQGRKVKNFVRVDATQALDKVFEEVTQRIMEFRASKRHPKLDGDS